MHNYRCYYYYYSHGWWWWLLLALAVLWSTQALQVVNADQHDQPPVYAIQIDQAHYIGYISENVHVKDGFVSFVDSIKPSFQVTSLDKVIVSQRGRHANPCQQLVNDGYLNITIENKNSNGPFAIDLSEYYDNRCFINIRLASSVFTLNREETAQYKIVVNLNGYYNAATAIQITINVLDDNDNDPIFENYEYSVDLRQVDIARWPSLSMRQLIALNSTDADLKRNTFTRYFIDGGHDATTDTIISKYFLLDYYTGILYTTSTIVDIFDETDVDKSVRINVKAVNLFNDMSYDLTSVLVNLIRYEWSSNDDRVEFRMQTTNKTDDDSDDPIYQWQMEIGNMLVHANFNSSQFVYDIQSSNGNRYGLHKLFENETYTRLAVELTTAMGGTHLDPIVFEFRVCLSNTRTCKTLAKIDQTQDNDDYCHYELVDKHTGLAHVTIDDRVYGQNQTIAILQLRSANKRLCPKATLSPRLMSHLDHFRLTSNMSLVLVNDIDLYTLTTSGEQGQQMMVPLAFGHLSANLQFQIRLRHTTAIRPVNMATHARSLPMWIDDIDGHHTGIITAYDSQTNTLAMQVFDLYKFKYNLHATQGLSYKLLNCSRMYVTLADCPFQLSSDGQLEANRLFNRPADLNIQQINIVATSSVDDNVYHLNLLVDLVDYKPPVFEYTNCTIIYNSQYNVHFLYKINGYQQTPVNTMAAHNLSYLINDETNPNGCFSLNRHNGLLSLNCPNLTRGQALNDPHRLEVIVTDGIGETRMILTFKYDNQTLWHHANNNNKKYKLKYCQRMRPNVRAITSYFRNETIDLRLVDQTQRQSDWFAVQAHASLIGSLYNNYNLTGHYELLMPNTDDFYLDGSTGFNIKPNKMMILCAGVNDTRLMGFLIRYNYNVYLDIRVHVSCATADHGHGYLDTFVRLNRDSIRLIIRNTSATDLIGSAKTLVSVNELVDKDQLSIAYALTDPNVPFAIDPVTGHLRHRLAAMGKRGSATNLDTYTFFIQIRVRHETMGSQVVLYVFVDVRVEIVDDDDDDDPCEPLGSNSTHLNLNVKSNRLALVKYILNILPVRGDTVLVNQTGMHVQFRLFNNNQLSYYTMSNMSRPYDFVEYLWFNVSSKVANGPHAICRHTVHVHVTDRHNQMADTATRLAQTNRFFTNTNNLVNYVHKFSTTVYVSETDDLALDIVDHFNLNKTSDTGSYFNMSFSIVDNDSDPSTAYYFQLVSGRLLTNRFRFNRKQTSVYLIQLRCTQTLGFDDIDVYGVHRFEYFFNVYLFVMMSTDNVPHGQMAMCDRPMYHVDLNSALTMRKLIRLNLIDEGRGDDIMGGLHNYTATIVSGDPQSLFNVNRQLDLQIGKRRLDKAVYNLDLEITTNTNDDKLRGRGRQRHRLSKCKVIVRVQQPTAIAHANPYNPTSLQISRKYAIMRTATLVTLHVPHNYTIRLMTHTGMFKLAAKTGELTVRTDDVNGQTLCTNNCTYALVYRFQSKANKTAVKYRHRLNVTVVNDGHNIDYNNNNNDDVDKGDDQTVDVDFELKTASIRVNVASPVANHVPIANISTLIRLTSDDHMALSLVPFNYHLIDSTTTPGQPVYIHPSTGHMYWLGMVDDADAISRSYMIRVQISSPLKTKTAIVTVNLTVDAMHDTSMVNITHKVHINMRNLDASGGGQTYRVGQLLLGSQIPVTTRVDFKVYNCFYSSRTLKFARNETGIIDFCSAFKSHFRVENTTDLVVNNMTRLLASMYAQTDLSQHDHADFAYLVDYTIDNYLTIDRMKIELAFVNQMANVVVHSRMPYSTTLSTTDNDDQFHIRFRQDVYRLNPQTNKEFDLSQQITHNHADKFQINYDPLNRKYELINTEPSATVQLDTTSGLLHLTQYANGQQQQSISTLIVKCTLTDYFNNEYTAYTHVIISPDLSQSSMDETGWLVQSLDVYLSDLPYRQDESTSSQRMLVMADGRPTVLTRLINSTRFVYFEILNNDQDLFVIDEYTGSLGIDDRRLSSWTDNYDLIVLACPFDRLCNNRLKVNVNNRSTSSSRMAPIVTIPTGPIKIDFSVITKTGWLFDLPCADAVDIDIVDDHHTVRPMVIVVNRCSFYLTSHGSHAIATANKQMSSAEHIIHIDLYVSNRYTYETGSLALEFYNIRKPTSGFDLSSTTTTMTRNSVSSIYICQIDENYRGIITRVNTSFFPSNAALNWSTGHTVLYEIVDGDSFVRFDLHPYTGELKARNDNLDYEEAESYALTIKAFSPLDGTHSNVTINVSLTVSVSRLDFYFSGDSYPFVVHPKDQNDNRPQFDRFVYTTDIDVTHPAKSFVFELHANDGDGSQANSIVNYKLLNHQDRFHISQTTGRLYTKIKFNSHVDRNKYRLHVQAYNPLASGHTNDVYYTTCWVIVRIVQSAVLYNKAPKFSANQYTYNVHVQSSMSNTMPVHTNKLTNSFYISDDKHLFVAKINAHNDMPVKYKMRHVYEHGLFVVNEVNGVISLDLDKYNRHYMDCKRFDIVLIAYDTVYSAYANVTIGIMDDVVWTNVFDLSILFANIISNCSINEDALPGTHVILLVDQAKQQLYLDNKDTVNFFIINGDENVRFEITKTGRLYTRRHLFANHTQKSVYNLDIMAYDGYYSAFTKVTVVVNKIAPPFDDQTCMANNDRRSSMIKLNVSELTPVSTIVSVPTTRPIVNLKYEIVDRPALLPFVMDETTGALRLIAPLDYETTRIYEFTIRTIYNNVNEDYCLTMVQVHVLDENDNGPVFEPFQDHVLALYENTPVNTYITTLRAHDVDSYANGLVHYHLSNQSLVKINRNLGYLLISSNIDRELIGSILNLTITASDTANAKTTTANLMIRIVDMNDNLPFFNDNTRSIVLDVDENLRPSTVVVRVNATDVDLEPMLAYRMAIDHVDLPFDVNASTGDVYVTRRLDYETNKNFTFGVQVYDSVTNMTDPDRSTVKVQVYLVDLNDNVPVFHNPNPLVVCVNETIINLNNRTIAVLVATDDDHSRHHSQIQYRLADNINGLFNVDERTGRVYINHYVSNYELAAVNNNVFNLTVYACNHDGLCADCQLCVTMQLSNRRPVLKAYNHTLDVTMQTRPNSVLMRFIVVDDDDPTPHSTANATPSTYDKYTFVLLKQYKVINNTTRSALTKKLFDINPNGSLLLKTMDTDADDNTQQYVLKVRVYNNLLVPPLYTDTQLTVRFVNDTESVNGNGSIVSASANNKIKYNIVQVANRIQYAPDVAWNGTVNYQTINENCFVNRKVLGLKMQFKTLVTQTARRNFHLKRLRYVLKNLLDLKLRQIVIVATTSRVHNTPLMEFLLVVRKTKHTCFDSTLIGNILANNRDRFKAFYKNLNNVFIEHIDDNCLLSFPAGYTHDFCHAYVSDNSTRVCDLLPIYENSCTVLALSSSSSSFVDDVPCADHVDPCLNNSTCLYNRQTSNVRCDCLTGFKGKYCDVDVNECESDRTNNCSRTCVNTYGSYTCLDDDNNNNMVSDASAAPSTYDMQRSNAFQFVRNKNEILVGSLIAVCIIGVILLATILTLCKLTSGSSSNLHKTPSTTTTASSTAADNVQHIKLKNYFKRNRNYTNSTNSRNFLLNKSQRCNRKKTTNDVLNVAEENFTTTTASSVKSYSQSRSPTESMQSPMQTIISNKKYDSLAKTVLDTEQTALIDRVAHQAQAATSAAHNTDDIVESKLNTDIDCTEQADRTATHLNESTNSIEDYQGFYWDITDWAGTLRSAKANTNRPNDAYSIYSNDYPTIRMKPGMSDDVPIYSKVKKSQHLTSLTSTFTPLSQTKKDGYDRLSTSNETNEEHDDDYGPTISTSVCANNYVYLLNDVDACENEIHADANLNTYWPVYYETANMNDSSVSLSLPLNADPSNPQFQQ